MVDLSGGACAGRADGSYAVADPFYPEPGKGKPTNDPYTEAREICARCPIRDICLQDALKETVQWGFRVMTPEERQELKSTGTVAKQRGAPTEADLEMRMALYHQGLTDPQIAARTGVLDKTITAWRKRNSLMPNHAPHRAHTPEQVATKHRMWENGATDAEIAHTVGCHVGAIRKWRARLKLPVNPSDRNPNRKREQVPA